MLPITSLKTIQKKNLIVFDIDGTLTDSVKLHHKVFTEMLHKIGVREIKSEYKSFKHHTDSFIAKEIYESDQKTKFTNEKSKEFEKGLIEKISRLSFNEIKGAKRLVEIIENETDFGVCFATGSLREAAKHKLKSINIKFNDKQLVASDNIYEREKIIQEAIKNSTEYYKVSKFDRIISIGDGIWDLLTARILKLEFIGVGLENEKILIENGADIIYNDLSEFKIILKMIKN